MVGIKSMAVACWALMVWSGLGAEEKLGRMELLVTNVVSLGTYPNTEDRTARVQIKNTGRGPLQIEHVVTTCKCMRIDAYPHSLAPDESGEVAVTIMKNEVSGAFERIFFIESDDPVTRSIKIRIEGNAKPLFLVTCDAKTELGPVEVGQVWTGRYTVAAAEKGVSLGSPVARERGTRSAYTVTTNQAERLVYEVNQVVTFEGDGILESELLFPVLGEGRSGLMPVKLSVCGVRRASFRIAPDQMRISVSATDVKRRLMISVGDTLPPDVTLLSWRTVLEGVEVVPRVSKSGKGFLVDVTFPVACVERLRDLGHSELLFKYRNGPEVALPVQYGN